MHRPTGSPAAVQLMLFCLCTHPRLPCSFPALATACAHLTGSEQGSKAAPAEAVDVVAAASKRCVPCALCTHTSFPGARAFVDPCTCTLLQQPLFRHVQGAGAGGSSACVHAQTTSHPRRAECCPGNAPLMILSPFSYFPPCPPHQSALLSSSQ